MPVPTMRGVTIDGREAGLYRRYFRRDDTLKLYLPLWHPDLNGSPFLSKDLNAHSCTVVGADWRSQGRAFDAVDDNIKLGNILDIAYDAPQTYLGWFVKSTATDTNLICKGMFASPYTGWYAGKIVGATGQVCYQYLNDVVSNGLRVATTTTGFNDGNWHFLAIIKLNQSASGVSIIIDGVSRALTTSQNNLTSNVVTTKECQIGSRDGANEPFDGTVGEVWVSNRALSANEAMQTYLATKWRYQ